MKPKQITYAQYLQAHGLFALATKHYAEGRQFEQALLKLIRYGDDYGGHISDAIFDNLDFDEALAKEKISVRKPTKAQQKTMKAA
jgi:hypothetical protein